MVEASEAEEEVEVVEAVRIMVKSMVKTVGRIKVKVKPGQVQGRIKILERFTPDMGQPGTRTCPRLNPALVTGFSESQLIFVRSQAPALGRMCGYLSQTNEIQASPRKWTKS